LLRRRRFLVRLIAQPEPLYESYKSDFDRPHVLSSTGQEHLVMTRMTWSRIIYLSPTHKNLIAPKVCATASGTASAVTCEE
jgi:hypothetical protein